MKEEKDKVVEKLFDEFIRDKDVIKENIKNVMENIMLVSKSDNYKATLIIKLEEIVK